MTSLLEDALNGSIETTRHNLGALEEFPESYQNGAWQPIEKDRAAGHWVDGFWTGLLWLAYAHTGDQALRAGAERWTKRLAHLKTNRGTHDLGFIFTLSHVLAGRLTGESDWYENAIQAAYTLIERYNPRGEYLQAWDDDGIRKWAGRTNIDPDDEPRPALMGQRNHRRCGAGGYRHAARAHIAAGAAAGRWLHRPCRRLQSGNWPLAAARAISGLQPRLMLVPRASLGPLWLRHLLSPYGESLIPGGGANPGGLHDSPSTAGPGAILGLQ